MSDRLTAYELRQLDDHLCECLGEGTPFYGWSFREFIEHVTGRPLEGSRKDISREDARAVWRAASKYKPK